MTVMLRAMFFVINVQHNLARPTLAVFNVMSNKSEVPLHSFAVTCFVLPLIVFWQRIAVCQNGVVVRFRRGRRREKVNLIMGSINIGY